MAEFEHPYVRTLREQYDARRISRRDFLRTVTLLGVGATAAYSFADRITGAGHASRAIAQDLPKGGRLRVGCSVIDISTPATYNSQYDQGNMARQTLEHLTLIDHDNIARPYLLESWAPSDDLRSWTLTIRDGVTWRKGNRPFTADDVVWCLNHVLDPANGSSVVGLMSYMFDQEESDGETRTVLWDANAIEKVDDRTVRLNLRTPQLAVPEHLFHYPLFMMDPEEGGVFGVGANGTGAFEMVEFELGSRALFVARPDYWGGAPHLDEVEFVHVGDSPQAALAALAGRQVDGLVQASPDQLDAFATLSGIDIYRAATATAGLARAKVTQKPWTDRRVRQALRHATDCDAIVALALRGYGTVGEHHHASPIHPEYAPLPKIERDVERARALLAEAGHPDGIDVEITHPNTPSWIGLAVQGLVEQWKEAGIRVAIRPVPFELWVDIWNVAPFTFGNWEHRPLGTMMYSLAYRTGVPWNESEWSNARFDEVLDVAEATPDVEARRALMAELESIMQDDGPLSQPVFRDVVTIFDSRVQGFQMHPMTAVWASDLAMAG